MEKHVNICYIILLSGWFPWWYPYHIFLISGENDGMLSISLYLFDAFSLKATQLVVSLKSTLKHIQPKMRCPVVVLICYRSMILMNWLKKFRATCRHLWKYNLSQPVTTPDPRERHHRRGRLTWVSSTRHHHSQWQEQVTRSKQTMWTWAG